MKRALLSAACVLGASTVAAAPLTHPRLHDPLRTRFTSAAAATREQNCPVAPPFAPLPSPFPSALQAAIDYISETTIALAPASIPGFSLLITYGDVELLRVSGGVANASNGVQWYSGTPSRIASVSKVLPSLLLHQLADRGAVTLDGVVADDCPAFAVLNPWDGAGNFTPSGSSITWRQLASQLSGLQREAPAGSSNTSAALEAIARSFLIAPPGGRPSYSNLAFAVLGHLLAECVVPMHPSLGLPSDLPSLVSQLITKPLGLAYTQFITTPDPGPVLDDIMAVGYTAGGVPIPQADYDLGWWYPAGAGVSTAEELNLLGRALLAAASGASGGSQLGLSPATARAMLSPLYREPDGSYLQGAPWEMRPRGLNASAYPPQTVSDLSGGAPYLVLNKGGNLPGYTALLALVPSLNVTLSALFNGGVDEFGYSDLVFDALLPPLADALASADPRPRGNPGPRDPSFYAGTYTNPAVEGAVVVQTLPGRSSSMNGGGRDEGFTVGGGGASRGEEEVKASHTRGLRSAAQHSSGTDTAAGQSLLYALQQGGTYSFFLDYFTTLTEGPAVAAAVAAAFPSSDGSGLDAAVNITAVDIFRAFFPPPSQLAPGALPCVDDVTLGLRGQYVYFYLTDANATASGGNSDSAGAASSSRSRKDATEGALVPVATGMPGFVPGVAYSK